MGTFRTIQGTAEYIDEQLNEMSIDNHVKIVSSNAVVISKIQHKVNPMDSNGELLQITINEVVNSVHTYSTPRIKKENK